jgi:hypothetical protein
MAIEIENRIEEGESHSLAAIANKIGGNQKVWDAEIREIFRCLEDIDINIKEIIRVLLLKPAIHEIIWKLSHNYETDVYCTPFSLSTDYQPFEYVLLVSHRYMLNSR